MGMMLMGLIGLGFIGYRQKSKPVNHKSVSSLRRLSNLTGGRALKKNPRGLIRRVF
jgi:hypothetical protein